MAVWSLLSRRRWIVLLVAAWVAFGLGLWGFLREDERATTAVYQALGLFKLRFPDSKYPKPSLYLEVARFLAPLALWLAAINGVLTLLSGQREEFRAGRMRGHVVVCGLGRRGRRLAELFRAQGYGVVGIERDAACPGIDACRRAGGLVLVGDATDRAVLRRAAAMRARCVVAVCADDETNAESASAVDEGVSRGNSPTRLVHIDEDGLRQALNARAVLTSSPDPPSVEFFSVAERGARALLRRHPLTEGHRPDQPPRLLVVGLGSLGSALVVSAARAWRAGSSDDPIGRLAVTVIDPLAGRRRAELTLRHPEVERWCDLDAVELDPQTAAFEVGVVEAAERDPPSRVYVCLEHERAALSAAVALHRRLAPRRIPVTVSVLSASDSVGRFLADDDEAGALEVVGLIEQSCTPELLLDSVNETMARAIHEVYVRHEGSPAGARERPNLRPWDELDEWVRDDNRAQARHVGAKLAALGCEIESDDGTVEPVDLRPDEVDQLARMEHDRWVAARLREGWRRGPRDEAARTHPDLVPWSQLTPDRQAIDRAFIVALPRLLATAGLRLRRRHDAASGDTLTRRS